MNWDAVGAIAEVAGAIAVIVTLGYLAVQIRDNTRAMRAQALSDVTGNLATEINLLAQGHDVLSVIMKTQADEDLTELERMILDAFLTQALMSRQNEFLQHQQGLLDDEVLISMQHTTLLLLSSSTARDWWEKEGKLMTADTFTAYVDGLLATGSEKDWWFDHSRSE